MKSGTLFFLGTGTLAFALAATGLGCQGGGGGTGATGTTTGIGGDGTGGNGTGGTSTTTTSGSTSTTTTGTGGAAQVVTIQDITTGKIGPKIPVQVKGAVAMSHKFLVSQSSTTGSCLWGVMLSAPGLTETGENTGILSVSYGTNAMLDEMGNGPYCPTIQQGEPAGDGFPDDVKPGDVLDITGKTDKFLLSSCGSKPTDSLVPQFQLSNVISAVKTGTATVPTPHVVELAELKTIAAQTDGSFFDKWGGVKVRVQNVAPVLVTPMGGSMPGVVGDYGKIKLEGSNAEVGDKIYYHGLLNFLKDPCHSGPIYADTTTTFTQIDAFVYLNFCTWDLEPENRCVDLAPPSDDCAGNLCP